MIGSKFTALSCDWLRSFGDRKFRGMGYSGEADVTQNAGVLGEVT
jgi:hypothetical protein